MRKTAGFLAFVFIMITAGCGDLTGTAIRIAGQYTLTTADDLPVPASIALEPGGRLEVIGGQLEITRGHAFAFAVDLRWTTSSGVSTDRWVDEGRIRRYGTDLVFESREMGVVYNGSVSGKAVTVGRGRRLAVPLTFRR